MKNQAATFLIWFAALFMTAVFICLLGDIIFHGFSGLSWEYLTQLPKKSGRAGGISSIIISTGLILFVAIATSAPLGLATAILLTEFTPKNSVLGSFIERSLDVLAAIPSIVFGLFGNAFFCIYLRFGFSILSGGLTLACMALPILIRTATEALRLVPNDYRLATAALGLTRCAALINLLLPAASSALVAGLMLGMGRALAETAALVFTSGYVDRMPESLSDSGRALSVHIYDLSMNVAGGDAKAHTAALVLIIMLLSINGIAMTLANHWQKRKIIIL